VCWPDFQCRAAAPAHLQSPECCWLSVLQGSGKTYTMGTAAGRNDFSSRAGSMAVIPWACQYVLQYVAAARSKYDITVKVRHQVQANIVNMHGTGCQPLFGLKRKSSVGWQVLRPSHMMQHCYRQTCCSCNAVCCCLCALHAYQVMYSVH
jgi:hypothetical protein